MGFIKRLLGLEPPKELTGNARERWYLRRNLGRDERIYTNCYQRWIDADRCPCCFEAGNPHMWRLWNKNERRRERLAELDRKLGLEEDYL